MPSSAASWQTVSSHRRQRDPLDLLAHFAPARPVADRQGYDGRRQQHGVHHRQAVEGPDQRPLTGQVPVTRCRAGSQPSATSPPGAGSAISLGCTTNPASASAVASRRQRSERAPARRRQRPGREQQQHEDDRGEDRDEAPLGQQAHQLRRRQGPGMGDAQHRIGRGGRHDGQCQPRRRARASRSRCPRGGRPALRAWRTAPRRAPRRSWRSCPRSPGGPTPGPSAPPRPAPAPPPRHHATAVARRSGSPARRRIRRRSRRSAVAAHLAPGRRRRAVPAAQLPRRGPYGSCRRDRAYR